MLNESQLAKVIHDNTRYYRLKNGMSQQELSQKAGISISVLQHIENQYRLPTTRIVNKIANGLNISLTQYLTPRKDD